MSPSVIGLAIDTARRAVTIALLGALTLMVGLLAERLMFERTLTAAHDLVNQASRLQSEILLRDEQLTMSATAAAASGDPRWVDRYNSFVGPMDKAIAAAKELAERDEAERFDRATRAANDRLLALEAKVLEAVSSGRPQDGAAIIAGADYAANKKILADGTDIFLAEISSRLDADISRIRTTGLVLLLLSVLAGTGGFWLLRRRVNRSLDYSEMTFLEQDARIRELAVNDLLTGLPNRRAFIDELHRTLARAERQDMRVAVMMIDLDRFKPINDRLGHLAGDRLLAEIARRLRTVIRRDEYVARLGGDEFVMLVTYPRADERLPMQVATRVIAALSAPHTEGDQDLTVGATVGYAVYPVDGRSDDSLMRKADVALYRAKAEGRGDARCFDEAMDIEIRQRAMMERDLKDAIISGQIVPYFQPLVDLETGRLQSFEVLARWNHPERGIIPPADFLPFAEKAGLLGEISLSVLRSACLVARTWAEPYPIAVNFAPEQVQDVWLPEKILKILIETRFPVARLEIELTENALVEDFETAKSVISYFKSKGVRVSLDDFGTGYSSLCHLSELPFDKIKIDRSFVQSLEHRPESAKIVQAIIGLGHSLGLPTIAEGVESEALADRLRALGCPQAQGYHYSRPMSADDVAAYVGSNAETVSSASQD